MSDSVRPHRQQPTRLSRPWDSPGKSTGVGCHLLLQCRKVKSESEVAQSCPSLHDPMDYSLPGSSVHGIFQARVLEWGAIAFSAKCTTLMKIYFSSSHWLILFKMWLDFFPKDFHNFPSHESFNHKSVRNMDTHWREGRFAKCIANSISLVLL